MASSDVVEYGRQAGRIVYDSYGEAPKGGGWSYLKDGTLKDNVYNVEITPDGDMFGSHSDLTNYLKAAELSGHRTSDATTFESHHLIPAEILAQVGISKEDGIAVAVDATGHMKDLHAYGGLEKNLVFTDIDQLKNYYRETYHSLGAPQWSDRVDEYVEANRDTFTQGLAAVADQLEAARPDPLAEPAADRTSEPLDTIAVDGDAVTDAGTDKV